MNYKMLRNILEYLVIMMLIVRVVTAALNVTFGGFTPILWFVIAIVAILLIICTEGTRLREFLKSKK